jgi:hypothetical protein
MTAPSKFYFHFFENKLTKSIAKKVCYIAQPFTATQRTPP